MTDAVYFVRPGDDNPELKWSLRALEANWSQLEDVWIIGHCPPWLTGVHHIPGNRFGDKPRNVYDNVRIACEHPDVPDEFVMMNDDFFITEPVDEIPIHYRGLLVDHIALVNADGGWWRDSLEATHEYLLDLGHTQPLSYDLHRPLPVVKAAMAQALADAADWQPDNPPQWRSIYGNVAGIGGTQAKDVKRAAYVHGRPQPAGFVSTEDTAFSETPIGTAIRRPLTEPSRWEA